MSDAGESAHDPDEVVRAALIRLHADRSDETAWRILFERLWPMLMATSYRLVGGDRLIAEDVSQDAFLRIVAYARFENLQEPRAMRAFASTIVARVARDEMARRARRHETQLDEHLLTSRGSPDTADSIDPTILMNALLRDVKESDRDIVAWLVAGYTLQEMATLSGRSYAALGMQVHRIRERLRKSLARMEIGDIV